MKYNLLANVKPGFLVINQCRHNSETENVILFLDDKHLLFRCLDNNEFCFATYNICENYKNYKNEHKSCFIYKKKNKREYEIDFLLPTVVPSKVGFFGVLVTYVDSGENYVVIEWGRR